MSAEDNIKLVHKLFTLYNDHDLNHLDRYDEVLAANVQLHDPAAPDCPAGIKHVKQLETGYMKGFPNKKLKIDQIFATNDQVAVYWTCTGTHKGQYEDIPATNHEIKLQE